MYDYKFNAEDCWYKDVCSKQDCNSSCIRYMEMDYLLYTSRIPKKRQYPVNLVPEEVDYKEFCKLADIKDDIVNFVNSGKNLYITSSHTGNGKTTWAIKLLLKYFDKVWAGNGFRCRGAFVNVPTFLNQLKDNISDKDEDFEQFKDNLLTADVVVWDDIASTALTQYEHSQLLTYIDNRVLQCKSNIYTGNLNTQNDLATAIGARLKSRVWNNSVIVEFKGSDRR